MQESAARSWSMIERGQFVLARCTHCDWHSHARRAYASAEKEAAEHERVCAGPAVPEPALAAAD